jgi:hypothetical protein
VIREETLVILCVEGQDVEFVVGCPVNMGLLLKLTEPLVLPEMLIRPFKRRKLMQKNCLEG